MYHPVESPNLPNELMTLRQIVNQYFICMHTKAHHERNTTIFTQKAIALQKFGTCISSDIGILESCKVTAIATGFDDQVVWKCAKERSVLIYLAS